MLRMIMHTSKILSDKQICLNFNELLFLLFTCEVGEIYLLYKQTDLVNDLKFVVSTNQLWDLIKQTVHNRDVSTIQVEMVRRLATLRPNEMSAIKRFLLWKIDLYLLWSIRREVFTEPFGYNSGYRSKCIKEHWNKTVILFRVHCTIIQLMAYYTEAQLA